MNNPEAIRLIGVQLNDFLINHEDDIASGVNDYGDLKLIFCFFVEREPKATNYREVKP